MRPTMLALAILPLFTTGCGAGYLLHVARGQGKILLGRVKIDDVLARDDLDPARRGKLLLVAGVKRYAVATIGLEGAESYATVFDTGAGPAAWNLSACDAAAFRPHVWRFPIVGTLPYKGFFEREPAELEARELVGQGMDVMLYGASAYSTLGWFDDPLFTSMLRAREHELASTVIHEMMHATAFVPSDAEFNETMATFVGNQGAIDYFRSVEGPNSPRAKAAEDSFHDDRVFARAIGDLRARLDAVYASELPRDGKLLVKKHELEDFPRRYREEVRRKLKTGDYDGYLGRKLNNASILALQRYHGELEVFAALHRKLGSDLRHTVERLKRLAGEPKPREALKEAAR